MAELEKKLFTKKKTSVTMEEASQEMTQKSFILSSEHITAEPSPEECWKILVVDDDGDVHSITNLALKDFIYKNKKIHFINTFSADETKPILQNNKDIALILLDVVMESTHAGLELIKYIREEINNKTVQIVLRTGQAGYAPEKEVISKYEINDYKTKTELTTTKLFILVFSSLRSYEALMELEAYSNELEKKVEEKTAEIRLKNKELEKLSLIAGKTDNSVVIALPSGEIQWANDGFTKIYGYTLEEFISLRGDNLLDVSFYPDFNSKFIECLENKKSVTYIACAATKSGMELWVNTNLVPILDNNGVIDYLIAMDTDITKIKKAEEEISCLYNIACNRKDEIEKQKAEIESQKKDIEDSINYAKIIQNSILPSEEKIKNIFPDFFIFYKPKDVVSGDFYYYTQVGDIHVVAVVDCTGHGVPGAFMSMIGCDILNQIIYKEGIVTPLFH
ncbi:MAG: PAS domain-containing protein [Bacteroidia bacterium]|nr:PAS domain-containing protein [Bacteroidia bacterium]